MFVLGPMSGCHRAPDHGMTFAMRSLIAARRGIVMALAVIAVLFLTVVSSTAQAGAHEDCSGRRGPGESISGDDADRGPGDGGGDDCTPAPVTTVAVAPAATSPAPPTAAAVAPAAPASAAVVPPKVDGVDGVCTGTVCAGTGSRPNDGAVTTTGRHTHRAGRSCHRQSTPRPLLRRRRLRRCHIGRCGRRSSGRSPETRATRRNRYRLARRQTRPVRHRRHHRPRLPRGCRAARPTRSPTVVVIASKAVRLRSGPLLRPYRRPLALAIALAIADVAVGLALPWPVKVAVDNVIGGHELTGWLSGAADWSPSAVAAAAAAAGVVLVALERAARLPRHLPVRRDRRACRRGPPTVADGSTGRAFTPLPRPQPQWRLGEPRHR